MKYRLILGAALVAAPLAFAVPAFAETVHPDHVTYANTTVNMKYPDYKGWIIRIRSLENPTPTEGDDLLDNQRPEAPEVTLTCAGTNAISVRVAGQDPTKTIIPVDGLLVADARVLDPSALTGFNLVHDQVVTRTVQVQGTNPRVRVQINAFDNSVADTRNAWVSFDMSNCAPPPPPPAKCIVRPANGKLVASAPARVGFKQRYLTVATVTNTSKRTERIVLRATPQNHNLLRFWHSSARSRTTTVVLKPGQRFVWRVKVVPTAAASKRNVQMNFSAKFIVVPVQGLCAANPIVRLSKARTYEPPGELPLDEKYTFSFSEER